MGDEKQPSKEDPREVLRPVGGRDELNLAEFPITLLSDRVPKGCKTLEFEIEPRDKQLGKVVSRKVMVTGSDAYGLPTAIDDEILVALVQLTKLKNGFTNPTVPFSRYEVLKLLGWPDDGRSYRRIEESIKRWAGVTLYYDNAWWNKESNSWVSETFHIIERSSIMEQESRRGRKPKKQHELPLSFFKWNEVIFQSFQAGSLKRLDIDAYFSFSTSIAKRMYRFLDKRFWVKPRWEFDLKEFAFEHIGLSRKYNVAQIKNKLQPAIEELSEETKERARFLEPMSFEERFSKIGKGQWVVTFSRKVDAPLLPVEAHQPEVQGLASELVARGVSAEVAAELVESRPAELISLRIDVFDWVITKKDQRIIKENPTGYLISSIRDRYLTVPKGFEPKADRKKREEAEEAKRRNELEDARRKRRERHLEDEARKTWDVLSEGERRQLEAQVLSEASPEIRDQYEASAGPLRQLLMTGLRQSYLRGQIEVAEAQEMAAQANAR